MDAGKSRRPYRRRQLIVDRSLQFPFVNAMVTVLIAMAAASLAAVAFAVRLTLSSYELSNNTLIVALFDTAFWIVMLELVVIIPLVIWFGIWLTHKVAGPLVRIHAVLAQMSRGDYDVRVKLRKGDMLASLADAINRLASERQSRSR